MTNAEYVEKICDEIEAQDKALAMLSSMPDEFEPRTLAEAEEALTAASDALKAGRDSCQYYDLLDSYEHAMNNLIDIMAESIISGFSCKKQ